MPGERVAIIGAGYAGMAAAVSLVERGVPVDVFEAGQVPGGRARRIEARGIWLDNGQHVLLGAYSALLGLMAKVGGSESAVLRLPLELRYADGFLLRAPRLPAPLGLLAGLLAAHGLSWADRLNAIRFMRSLRGLRYRLIEDCTVSELLARHGQSGALARYLWHPLCVSALNTLPAQASANIFLAVLRDGLAGSRADSDLLLPRLDLSRLFPEPAAAFISSRGGKLYCEHRISDLGALRADYRRILVAVGPHQLKALLPELDARYEYQPIYTCYLQYPAPLRLRAPMLGLDGDPVQWVFDRGMLMGEHGRLACVISAQGPHQQLAHEELAMRCHAQLAAALPHLAPPEWSRVVAEKRATLRADVNLTRLSPRTGLPGVLLAGDYLDPEYPPTLEAAVRSGIKAAALALGA